MTDQLMNPAKGAFTISTAWTSTTPFGGQTTSFKDAATAKLFSATRAVYSGGGGTLALIMIDGSTMSMTSLPAGSLMPIRTIALSSLNTATGLVGLY